ncbi:MAG TPA: dehypoxanthine futalosine cyclase, partial [Bacteroidales bacterium]|nr:dehypoxanthine futalosine cyclase [Bacteroidales bacterium]
MGIREHLYGQLSGGGRITADEALTLWEKAPIEELLYVADQLRKKLHPENRVGWMIDR